jgi:hypothetical protein
MMFRELGDVPRHSANEMALLSLPDQQHGPDNRICLVKSNDIVAVS